MQDKAALCAELRQIWQLILKIDVVEPDDDFFVLGGDSLQLVEMVVRLSARYEVDFDYDLFFQQPTIRTLVSVLIRGGLASAPLGIARK